MVACGEAILQFARGGKPRFLEDRMARDATERQFELLGRAAARVSPAFRDATPEIPWRTLVALADALAKGDGSVAPERLWEAIGKPLRTTLDSLEPFLR